MNLISGNNQVPLVGQSGQPTVLNAQVVITPQLKEKLGQFMEETGIHMFTLGNVLLTLGLAQLSKILDDENQTEELRIEIDRIEEERSPKTQ